MWLLHTSGAQEAESWVGSKNLTGPSRVISSAVQT
eukprot:CAMPEP_0179249434 /NCGR_PEP_ID=MMETSP0797-20121207/20645_1 /TAXON_ID=47934 /ORGANISM="Dinophysis acuminata, Strain DAEP01" /LENGTH=34 /DNA_ID= /DNA_START= /DNA_END= /DNA_ORIENTATION=